jgi:hypothetical protein
MVDVAKHYQVSRQMIKQVVDRYLPKWAGECGKVVLQKQREEKHFKKWGVRQTTDLYKIQRLKFSRKKSQVLRSNQEWSIDFSDLNWPLVCPILGIPINYYAEITEEGSPSFDRINSTKAYVKGNVHIISWRANRIKNDGTATEHRLIANYIDKISLASLDSQDISVV